MADFISWAIGSFVSFLARTLELTSLLYYLLASIHPALFVVVCVVVTAITYGALKLHSRYIKSRFTKEKK